MVVVMTPTGGKSYPQITSYAGTGRTYSTKEFYNLQEKERIGNLNAWERNKLNLYYQTQGKGPEYFQSTIRTTAQDKIETKVPNIIEQQQAVTEQQIQNRVLQIRNAQAQGGVLIQAPEEQIRTIAIKQLQTESSGRIQYAQGEAQRRSSEQLQKLTEEAQAKEKRIPVVSDIIKGGKYVLGEVFAPPMQEQELSNLQKGFFSLPGFSGGFQSGLQKAKASINVGVESGRYLLFGGLRSTQSLFYKGGEKISSQGGIYPWAGAGVELAGDFIPTSIGQWYTYGLIGKAYSTFPKIVETSSAIYGTYGLTQATTPKEYLSSGLYLGVGAIPLSSKLYGTTRTLISSKRIDLEIPSGTPLRNRATIILKDNSGKILYELDKPTGTYMLPGGAIESGEIPIQSARRELFEETGLKNIDLKFKEIIKTPEQTHYIYEAQVDKSILSNIKLQGKEVSSLKFLNIPKYTGPSALQPFGRVPNYLNIFNKRIVRAEDLYVGSKSIYGDLKQTTFTIKVPGEIFRRRGEAIYLTKRVGKYDLSRLFGYKPGQFKKFQAYPSIQFGFGSRYDIPFKELKKYSGKNLWYAHGTPSRIQTELKFESKGLPKSFGDIQVGDFFKVLKEKGKRGESVLYFQPPTISNALQSKAYIGGTYLGLYRKPRASYSYGISLKKFGEPTIYLTKAKLGEELIPTGKAMRGTEFEVGAVAGTSFEQIGKKEKIYLAGTKVGIERLRIVKLDELTKERKIKVETQERIRQQEKYYYETGKRPVSVIEVFKDIYSPTYKYEVSKVSYKYPSVYKTGSEYKYPSTYKIKEGLKYSTGYKSGEGYNYPVIYKISKPYSYTSPTKSYSYPIEKYKTPGVPTKPIPYSFPSKKSQKLSTPNFYGVQVRRGKKFKTIGTGMTLEQAMGTGRERASGTLAATYKIFGGPTKGLRTPKGFYTKYSKKEGLVFIELPKYRISKIGEKIELAQARRMRR